MKAPAKLALLLLALVAIASTAVAWREYREVLRLRAAAPDPEERVRLQKAAWDAQKRANQLAAQLAAARAAPGGAGGAGAAPGDQTRVLGEYASQLISRIDDPEVRRLMDIVQKGQIDRRFAALFKALKLSPEQLAQFQQLLVERQNAGTDVLIAASQQGITPLQDPQQFRQMVQQAQADLDDRIKSTLGADNYAQFQAYQQTQGQRGIAEQLQQDLSYTESPLSDTQRDQVTQIIAQSAAAGRSGGGAINDTTVSLAQGVLSPPQVQALQNLQQQQQASAQLQHLMSQGSGGGDPPATP
jgi:uncharacterized phage infection (PIP) family protein YhgE